MSDDMEARRGVRRGFEGMARKMGLVVDDIRTEIGKEMAYAVDDIRQQVVERPWFERVVTPELVKEWDSEKKTPEMERDEGPRDFRREDLYGRDPADHDRDIEDGREHLRDHDRDQDLER